MRISDWSSDVCSSDLEIANLCIVILRAGAHHRFEQCAFGEMRRRPSSFAEDIDLVGNGRLAVRNRRQDTIGVAVVVLAVFLAFRSLFQIPPCRSEEHTSELQSLMRISYAVFCLKKKNKHILK